MTDQERGTTRPGPTDTSVKKIDARHSPKGEEGQLYLVSGKRASMRLWVEEPGDEEQPAARDYETLGYVLEGRAELSLEGQRVQLCPGDSWLVPKGAHHSYRILEPFRAVETTSPPARIHDRDAPKHISASRLERHARGELGTLARPMAE